MKLNTAGPEAQAQHDAVSGSGNREEMTVDKDQKGTEVKLSTSGANEVPDTGVAPKSHLLNSGPKVDEKGAYRPSRYEQTIRHSSNNEQGFTKMVRQDN